VLGDATELAMCISMTHDCLIPRSPADRASCRGSIPSTAGSP
jgi:hypothetical protein